MVRHGTWFVVGVWLLILAVSGATAADTESRDFTIQVDGKPAGEYHLTIRKENGAFSITGKADVRVRTLFYTYVYSYQGSELWKDNRLQKLESTTVDGRKRFSVTAWADGNALRIKVHGQERVGRPDVWTTSYWRVAPGMPDAKFRNWAVPLLDVDNGRELKATLQHVGSNQINVAGKMQNCTHYRVTGDGVQVDVWYDAQERMVREEMAEDGHRTVLELIRMGQ